MKAFDLEEAKAGKPVCTRNGSPARIICFDKKPIGRDRDSIVALVHDSKDETEIAFYYPMSGLYFGEGFESENDLMMAEWEE